MLRNRAISNLIFWTLTALISLMTIVSFLEAVRWINKPFPGFLVYRFPNVGSVGNKEWPGYKEGIKYLDKIVHVDGKPIKTGEDLTRAVEEKAPGTIVHYGIESSAGYRDLALPVVKFAFMDFLVVFLLPFLVGFAIYLVGIVVFMLKPATRTSWVFFVMCVSIGTYLVTAFEIHSSYHFVMIHYAIMSLMPATLLNFGLIFPSEKGIVVRHPGIQYLIYVPAVLIALSYEAFLFMQITEWPPAAFLHPKVLTPINRVFTLVCLVALVILLIHSFTKAPNTVAKQRARLILFGLTFAFLPSVIVQAVVVLLGVNIPWNLLVAFVVVFPAAIAYSIVRHNLFDADTIIRRTVGYVLVTGIVIAVYGLVGTGINLYLGKYDLSESKAFPLLFTLAIIFLFNPLRDRVQLVVDKIFFRREYDYGAIVDKVGKAMTSMLDLGQIMKVLIGAFVEEMFVSTGSVLLLDAAGGSYQVKLAGGEHKNEVERVNISGDHPFISSIETRAIEFTQFDVLEDQRFHKVKEECLSVFQALKSSMAVPLLYKNKLIGILALGEKKSGKAYKREDVDLLRNLANQGAVAIENARLFAENLEKQRMEEELAIARDLQMSMLPQECPSVDGFAIAAHSHPAMEVGGDFYDFFKVKEGVIGFVVGDVTGKSVSGALVMSASRSVFRMLSEETLDVGDVMRRANRRIKQDIVSGMFVALLYAIIDSTERTVRLSSAGQTQPILFSSSIGKAALVDTQGDNFPLGILEDAAYEETSLYLSKGDKIVFYTDGIVEAMNKENEIFGFERLISTIESAHAEGAENLLKAILSSVDEFVGAAEQHDDMTIIVLSADN